MDDDWVDDGDCDCNETDEVNVGKFLPSFSCVMIVAEVN